MRSVRMMGLVGLAVLGSLVIAERTWSGSLTIPFSFTNGTVADATQVNSNFNAAKAAIDDNDSRVTAIESSVTPTGVGTFASNNSSGSFQVHNFGEGITGTVLMSTIIGNNSLGPQLRFTSDPGGSGTFIDIGQNEFQNFVIENASDQQMMALTQAGQAFFGLNTGTAQLNVNTLGFSNRTVALKGRAGDLNVFGIENSDGTTILQMAQNGNFFINVGEAFKTGGGSWAAISDARLKEDIHSLDGALDRMLELDPVTFQFRDPAAIGERPGTHIGFTAQQVETVFPEWVGERKDGIKYVAPKGFEALTVAAMHELRTEKDAQIEKLEAENSGLRERLASLEAAVARLAGGEK